MWWEILVWKAFIILIYWTDFNNWLQTIKLSINKFLTISRRWSPDISGKLIGDQSDGGIPEANWGEVPAQHIGRFGDRSAWSRSGLWGWPSQSRQLRSSLSQSAEPAQGCGDHLGSYTCFPSDLPKVTTQRH